MPRPLWRRLARPLHLRLLLLSVAVVLWLYSGLFAFSLRYLSLQLDLQCRSPPFSSDHLSSPQVRRFWRSLRDVLSDVDPGIGPVPEEEEEDHDGRPRTRKSGGLEQDHDGDDDDDDDDDDDPYNLDSNDMARLRQSHLAMRKAARDLGPSLPFAPHRRGIVTVSREKDAAVIVAWLRTLRRVGGTRLPVTVMLESWAEYTSPECEAVLPSLGAECVVLSDLLDTAPPSVPVQGGHQLAALSLLFSPFQQVLFMDLDVFPVGGSPSPDTLFIQEPFLTAGLVTWPRPRQRRRKAKQKIAGRRLFYSVAGLRRRAGAQTRDPGPADPHVLLLDKARHAPTLLLAAYYSVFGPACYFPLLDPVYSSYSGSGPSLSATAAEEEGINTLGAAALALSAPVYQVESPASRLRRALGDGGGAWQAAGVVVQADPLWDLEARQQPFGPGLPPGSLSATATTTTTPRPLFFQSLVRLDPRGLAETSAALLMLLANSTGGSWRGLWREEMARKGLTADVEGFFWQQLAGTDCSVSGREDCYRLAELARVLA